MRYVKRTMFNIVLQPKRIGKLTTPKSLDKYDTKTKYPKRTTLEKFRRGFQGSHNKRYSKFIRLKVIIKYFINLNKQPKKSPTFMRKRAYAPK